MIVNALLTSILAAVAVLVWAATIWVGMHVARFTRETWKLFRS